MRAAPADQGQLHRPFEQQVDHAEALGEAAGKAGDHRSEGADGAHRRLTQLRPVQVIGDSGERRGGDGVGGGRRPVGAVSIAHDQLLMITRRVEEAARLFIEEVGEGALEQPLRLAQPANLTARLVQVDQPLGQVGVVLQVGIEVRLPGPIGSQQAAVLARERRQDEVGGAFRRFDVSWVADHPVALGQRADHQAVPGGEDLVVQAGLHPVLAGRVHFGARLGQRPLKLVGADAEVRGDGLQRVRRVGYALPLPIAAALDVVVGVEPPRLFFVQHLGDLFRRPDEELPLHAFRVGVGGRVDAALRRRHLAQDVVERLHRHAPQAFIAGDLVALQVSLGEQRVVVQHLLEVRDQPLAIGGITAEAAADVVVHAAPGHRVQCLRDHLEGLWITEAAVQAQQQLQAHRGRELRRRPETAVPGIELPRVGLERRLQLRDADGEGGLEALLCAQVLSELAGALLQAFPVAFPRLADLLEDRWEAGPPVHVVRREVGAGEHGLQVGREKHRHRPAALAAVHGHGGRHIDLIEVGPLFAVDLDVDELLVHQRGDRLVLERLALHHVTPVAGGVADAQQDELVLAPRLLQRLLAPRVPVDGVVGVLEQVGAGLVDQPVGVPGGLRVVGHRRRCLGRQPALRDSG